jgi:hypothetical protein
MLCSNDFFLLTVVCILLKCFLYPFTYGHLDCFQFGTMIDLILGMPRASDCVDTFLFPLEYIGVEWYSVSMPSFLRNSQFFSQVDIHFNLHSHQKCVGLPFLPYPHLHLVLLIF